MRCTGVSILVVVIALTFGAAVARADGQTDDQKRADALFTEGRKLIDANDNAGACAKFGEAIKLDPDAAGTMLNLGLCNEKLQKYRSALFWFRKAQSRAHETKLPEYEKAAGEHTTTLVELVATVKVVIAGTLPPDAKVKIDGDEVPPVEFSHAEVDTGHHSLDAGAPGHKSVHQEFDVVGKGGQTLTIELVVGDNSVIIDRGAGRRRIALVTAISGGVLLLASGAISFYAKYEYGKCINSLNRPGNDQPNVMHGTYGCTAADPVDYVNHYHNIARWGATPPFVVGALAVAIGGYLYFTAPQRERLDRTVFVPAIAPDQVGFAAVGRF